MKKKLSSLVSECEQLGMNERVKEGERYKAFYAKCVKNPFMHFQYEKKGENGKKISIFMQLNIN
jgi:hypothetical protein